MFSCTPGLAQLCFQFQNLLTLSTCVPDRLHYKKTSAGRKRKQAQHCSFSHSYSCEAGLLAKLSIQWSTVRHGINGFSCQDALHCTAEP